MLSNEILEYIEENLKENITLVELSGRYHYSPRQLYYYLHEITGMPIMAYIDSADLSMPRRRLPPDEKCMMWQWSTALKHRQVSIKPFFNVLGAPPANF